MIHLVTSINRHLYERHLGRFFAASGHVDGYDDEHAAYLLALDPDGDVGIGVRLRPTAHGSILANRFARLIGLDRALLDASGTLEVSHFVGGFQDREDRCRGELGLAILEAAQLLGASGIVGTVHLAQWALLDSCGWRVGLLGVPMPGPDGTMVAFKAGASADDVGAMREAWAIERALIYLDDEITDGLPVELVGGHADEWGRLTVDERRVRLIGRQIAESLPGSSAVASCKTDRGALEETLLILDTIINQQMLQRLDNDLRQQGAITLLSIAQNRLRAQLARSELPLSAGDVDLPAFRSTH